MSSFSDTFTRDENKDTQYDDSAFYTFAGTILLVSIIPLIYKIFKRIFYTKELYNKKYKNCQCKNCKERLRRHYARITKGNFNFTFYLMIFMVVLLSYLFYLSYFEIVKHGNNFKRFDPYEILEIPPTAEKTQIKKAYRRLTLLFHPDKNPNNLQAKAKFMMIAKAYETLTDEVAAKNFELYGNPDGPGSMRLAVGLPSFVLNKKNHMPILVLFLIIIVIIIPAFVWFWFSNNNKYDETGMIVEDQKIFYEFLNENILLRQMPFVLGAAMEYTNLTYKSDKDELYKIWKQYKDQMPKHKEEAIPLGNKLAISLLYAYVYNHPFESKEFNEDMEVLLKTAPVLITNMYNMSIYFTNFHLYNKAMKHFGYDCIKTILEFSQIIHQKSILNSKEPLVSYLQMPHFTEARLKNYKKPFQGKELKINTLPLAAFQYLTDDFRTKVLKTEFTDSEVEEIDKALDALPKYKLNVETFVEGFEEILVDDLLTIKITVERINLEEGQELGVGHSNTFPEIFKEKVAILIKNQQGNRIVYEVILDIDKRITTYEFKHMIREIGMYSFQAELFSFNYKSYDLIKPFCMRILPSSEKRRAFIENIEKKEVKKLEPSLFQQMLSQVFPIQDDEEEEEENEGENESQEKEESINEINEENSTNKLIEEPTEDYNPKRRNKKTN